MILIVVVGLFFQHIGYFIIGFPMCYLSIFGVLYLSEQSYENDER